MARRLALTAVMLLPLCAPPSYGKPTFLDQISATLTIGDAPCSDLESDRRKADAESWLLGAVAGMRHAVLTMLPRPYMAEPTGFGEAEQLAFGRETCKALADQPVTLGELAALIDAENRRRQAPRP